MSELSRDALLGIVRDVWERHDPVPEHLVTSMQAVAALAASDLDVELMELVEQASASGVRGQPAFPPVSVLHPSVPTTDSNNLETGILTTDN